MIAVRIAATFAAVLAASALPSISRAHEVSQQVERRGAAFAVRARYHGGGPLAGATYQVLRPGVPDRIEREGRTDAQGWIELVPDVPGRWRVRIVDASGHGLVAKVDVAEIAPPPAPAAAPGPPPAPEPRSGVAPAAPSSPDDPGSPRSGFWERARGLVSGLLLPAAGALAIGLFFAVLRELRRRAGR
jgi:hypothetical protein